MALSQNTYINLAKALQYEVADFIREDYRYTEFMMELVTDAIVSKLGPVDEDVMMDLTLVVMDRLDVYPRS